MFPPDKTMPATSKKQLRAMAAAMGGSSNIGIPQSVGKEFVKATPKGANLPESAPKKGKKGKDFRFSK